MTNVQNTTEFKKLTFWERNKLSGGYLLQKVVMERAVSIRVEFYSKDQYMTKRVHALQRQLLCEMPI